MQGSARVGRGHGHAQHNRCHNWLGYERDCLHHFDWITITAAAREMATATVEGTLPRWTLA